MNNQQINQKEETGELFYLKNFKPFFYIIGFGFLLYLPTLFFNFTYLDDNNLIIDNQYFLSNLANIFPSFLTDVFHLFNHSAFYYRPILTISLIISSLIKIFIFLFSASSIILLASPPQNNPESHTLVSRTTFFNLIS